MPVHGRTNSPPRHSRQCRQSRSDRHGLTGSLWTPCCLRHPPVNSGQKIGQLRNADGNNTGHRNRPRSSLFVNRHAPWPSCQMILMRSPRRPLKTNRRGNAGTGCQGDRCCPPQRCRGQRRVHTSTGPKDFDSATASSSGPPAVADGGATVIFIRSWSTRFRLSKTLPQLR